MEYDEAQVRSINACLNVKQRCAATSGPAGSGKTTIIREVHSKLVDAGYSPVLCAPTGKAAKRIREATGIPALTMHRMLEFSAPWEIDERTGRPYGDTRPKRTRENPLAYDTVIGDEYAMVHRELHRDVVSALPTGGRLLTFGDIHQLAPIEKHARYAQEPTAFRMLLDKFAGVELLTVHRQQEGSGILANAQRVLKGTAPKNAHDFNLCVTDQPVDTVRDMLERADFRALDNQIITPSNKSWIGTLKLNDVVQRDLMPVDSAWYIPPRHKWDTHRIRIAVGDKLVVNKNHYDLQCSDGTQGVFNGEVGRVIEITGDDTVVLDLEDRVAFIPIAIEVVVGKRTFVNHPQADLSLAYVLTTHKCQGSEYKRIVYVLNKSVNMMLNRRNLYTALTRAREHVWFVTDMRALSLSLATKEQKSWS